MEPTNCKKYLSPKKLKQVKVDNWGTFFLQRLLQLYFNEELLDFNIRFLSNNNILKVHKLVITTCTDYFLQLEREQIRCDSNIKDMITMPSDMPYECVKSIISFMYTGQLEYWTTEQNALYYTAQKMKMSVLTKLLDAQLNSHASKHENNDCITEPNFFVTSQQKMDKKNDLLSRCTFSLEENKYLLPKRKLNENLASTTSNNNLEFYKISDERKDLFQNSEGPSRFDLPEIEDLTLGVFSSFDDITYHTKPIIQAPAVINYKENVGSNNNITNMVVRINSNVNCVEVQNEEILSSEDEWINLQPDIRQEKCQVSPLKRLRYDFNEKENFKKLENNQVISSNATSVDSVHNHAKIIREVLKNYPHLIKHNKNIRLKIMQKESKNNEWSSGRTKISYVVLKSDSLMVNNADYSDNITSFNNSCYENNESGPWKCTKCNLNEEYTVYCLYRSHMQDVHGEKFDPRICQHCGFKATKRNILMYHLYTKHNVPPPKSMSFPKCHLCSYVALSESLLTRHLNNHKNEHSKIMSSHANQQMVCFECEKHFTEPSALVNHKIITGHEISENNTDQMYLCLHCGKQMSNSFTLQMHLECYHKQNSQFLCSQSPAIISDQSSDDQITEDICQNLSNEASSLREIHSQQKIKSIRKVSGTKSIPINNLENSKPLKIINNRKFQHTNSRNIIPTFIYSDDQHIKQNDEIVEEVVEELDTADIRKYKEPSKKGNSNQNQIICKSIKNDYDDQKDCLYNSQNSYSNFKEMSNIITYVEEETEIVEYETFNHI